MLDDFHQATATHTDQDIADVNELLELGKNAILSDSGQLASQLVGRLYDVRYLCMHDTPVCKNVDPKL